MTSFEDDLMRRVLERAPPPPAGPCPDEGDLAAWAEGRADAALRAGVEDHLAACAPCRALALDLRDTLAEAGRADVGASRGPVAPPLRRAPRVAVAAAILLAMGATWAFLSSEPGGAPASTEARLVAAVAHLRAVDPEALAGFEPVSAEERRRTEADAVRSGLLLSEPAGIVGTGRPRFAWSSGIPIEGAEVTVVATDGTEVWRRATSGGSLAYPADAPALEAGRDYVVEVAVRGAAHATSASRAFRVASPAEAERRGRAITAVEREAPRDLTDLLAAEVLARQGWWLEAEMRARRHAEAHPDDTTARETWAWIRRHLGWPAAEAR